MTGYLNCIQWCSYNRVKRGSTSEPQNVEEALRSLDSSTFEGLYEPYGRKQVMSKKKIQRY